MDGRECHRRLLARSGPAEVAACTCGHLHLSVGPVTLRLDEGVLHALWGTLGEALAKLAEPACVPSSAAGPGRPTAASAGWKQ